MSQTGFWGGLAIGAIVCLIVNNVWWALFTKFNSEWHAQCTQILHDWRKNVDDIVAIVERGHAHLPNDKGR